MSPRSVEAHAPMSSVPLDLQEQGSSAAHLQRSRIAPAIHNSPLAARGAPQLLNEEAVASHRVGTAQGMACTVTLRKDRLRRVPQELVQHHTQGITICLVVEHVCTNDKVNSTKGVNCCAIFGHMPAHPLKPDIARKDFMEDVILEVPEHAGVAISSQDLMSETCKRQRHQARAGSDFEEPLTRAQRHFAKQVGKHHSHGPSDTTFTAVTRVTLRYFPPGPMSKPRECDLSVAPARRIECLQRYWPEQREPLVVTGVTALSSPVAEQLGG
eukprot:CAMPEP_0171082622 /NCGR_PEP_ID=MMETSP0766_2-20121228/17221_1 /TAXON_ID=439317 /ORGANISM="Gambierdiscus australes, Strain CAWD 149" /LENGTH=269 /DNA_ID=CAMNT_0011539997 /DNA_START=23 /DNA_END=832 /DNA_ORIENTATION=+